MPLLKGDPQGDIGLYDSNEYLGSMWEQGLKHGSLQQKNNHISTPCRQTTLCVALYTVKTMFCNLHTLQLIGDLFREMEYIESAS